jgi:hypothetical protein
MALHISRSTRLEFLDITSSTRPSFVLCILAENTEALAWVREEWESETVRKIEGLVKMPRLWCLCLRQKKHALGG